MSTGDKRSVTTDALETLGTIHVAPQKRDAIHLAVEPVIAGERLRPGEHINVTDGVAYGTEVGTGLGIVDPFLPRALKKGEPFWFVMYPRMVHSLRHVWTHPQFADEAEVVEPGRISKEAHIVKSEDWIAQHANELGLSADMLMEYASGWLQDEDHIVQHGSERWRDNFNPTEFWHHYEVVTGTVVDPEKKQSIFCCSC